MAAATKTETTGKATFSSQHSAVFRFAVTSVGIWLEDDASKKQWQCEVSSANDFALKGAGIPHAVVMDALATSLASFSRGTSVADTEADLLEMSEGRMRLDLLLKFATAGVVWQPEYQFVLQPIPLTETQVLKAQLRDKDEELERLRLMIPLWVLQEGRLEMSRDEVAFQVIALGGAKAWWYLCGLAKSIVEGSAALGKAARPWGTERLHEAADQLAKYWWAAWQHVKGAAATLDASVASFRKLLEEECEDAVGNAEGYRTRPCYKVRV